MILSEMSVDQLGILLAALTLVLLFLAFVIAWISYQVRKANVAKWEMLFKQDLLDQGLSIDEIDRLLTIGNYPTRKPTLPDSGVSPGTDSLDQTIAHGSPSKPLMRSVTDREVAGVLGGIAEKFNFDATMLRVAFVVTALVTGGFPLIALYFIAAFLIPSGSKATVTTL